jgi:hypothetical protein
VSQETGHRYTWNTDNSTRYIPSPKPGLNNSISKDLKYLRIGDRNKRQGMLTKEIGNHRTYNWPPRLGSPSLTAQSLG